MTNILNFRNKLCDIGKSLFDELPTISSSYRRYNIDNNSESESTPEENTYKIHINKCPICSEVIKSYNITNP